nr:PREDICTED: protein AKNAD1 [Latimeria chalumnae]|eukprot:XP_014350558.1 PREDICTED: protein AKNAD1 [Latimeria chalumnae]
MADLEPRADAIQAALDPDSGSEELNEDFFSRMDENGIIGLDNMDDLYLPYPPELEPLDEWGESGVSRDCSPLGKSSDYPLGSFEDESFNISEFVDSEPLQLTNSAGEDSSLSPLIFNKEEQEEDKMPEDLDDSLLWLPERDRQLDMTEDEQAISVDLDQQDYQGVESEEEYPELPSDESVEELGLDTLQDSKGLCEEYAKVLNLKADCGDEVSAYSAYSFVQSEAQVKDSCQLGASSGVTPKSHSQFGDTMTFPLDEDYLKPGGDFGCENHDVTSTFGSTKGNIHRTFLSHVSVEDLVNSPNIDAETFPESSHTDSADESTVNIPSSIGRGPIKGHWEVGSSNERPNVLEASREGKDSWVTTERRKSKKNLHAFQKAPALEKGPSKVNRQSRSLSPRRSTMDKRAKRTSSLKLAPSRLTSSAEPPKYGRGQLNYPLPDFSKVEEGQLQ